MTQLLAIDPGPETCGVVLLDVDEFPPTVLEHRPDVPIDDVLFRIVDERPDHVAVERFASQRKKLGNESIYTIEVVGRIWQLCLDNVIPYTGIYRREVKQELGLVTTTGDPEVNEVLRYTYPATGGGKKPQVGIKGKPGPLYGVKKHSWAALGVGVAWCLRRIRERRAAELELLKGATTNGAAQRGLGL